MLSLVASPTRTGEGSLRERYSIKYNNETDFRLGIRMGKIFKEMNEFFRDAWDKMGQFQTRESNQDTTYFMGQGR